jgi:hypothetical protein
MRRRARKRALRRPVAQELRPRPERVGGSRRVPERSQPVRSRRAPRPLECDRQCLGSRGMRQLQPRNVLLRRQCPSPLLRGRQNGFRGCYVPRHLHRLGLFPLKQGGIPSKPVADSRAAAARAPSRGLQFRPRTARMTRRADGKAKLHEASRTRAERYRHASLLCGIGRVRASCRP